MPEGGMDCLNQEKPHREQKKVKLTLTGGFVKLLFRVSSFFREGSSEIRFLEPIKTLLKLFTSQSALNSRLGLYHILYCRQSPTVISSRSPTRLHHWIFNLKNSIAINIYWKMRTRRETVVINHDTANEKSNSENNREGAVKQDTEEGSENDPHSKNGIKIMNYDAHQEIDIDSLVTKTLQRFSSSKYNSKSRACSALHSRLISSGKLADRKLQALKGAIENQTWKAGNPIEDAQNESILYDFKNAVAPPLKEPKIVRPETVGKGWFDFQPLVIDEKIKRDIKMIQMRNYLDPKRFYKNPDKMGKVLHVGTVIEGPSEYFSSRLSRKDRKQTIVEEILGDQTLKNYSKRKYMEIQFDKSNKKRMFRVKKKGGKK